MRRRAALNLTILCCALAAWAGTPALSNGRTVVERGTLSLELPTGYFLSKKSVNFETDAYRVRTKAGYTVLVVVVGGGAYDLRGYQTICLNGRKAWSRKTRARVFVVAGQPGQNAVSFTSFARTPREDHDVNAILHSAIVFNGQPCPLSR